MKTAVSALMGSLLLAGAVAAQKLPQSQVPSVIVNNFQKAFPKAADVEWKKKDALYKVEFETGTNKTDHDVWYDATGKLVKHKEEIATSALPAAVQAKIAADFAGYTVKDAEKITEGTKETYKATLKKQPEKWEVVFDAQGNIVSKKAD